MKIGTSGPLVGAGFTQGSVIFAGVGGVLTEDNANFYWDDTNNRLGIGVTGASVLYRLHVVQTFTTSAANELTFRIDTTWNPAAGSANFVSAGQCACTKAGAQNISHEMGIRGLYMAATNIGSGTVVGECAYFAWVLNQSTGTITNAVNYFCETPLAAVGNALTNTFGLYIKTQAGTGITNSWGVYSEGASDFNYMNGRLFIGTNVAGSRLQVLANPNDFSPYSLTNWNGTGQVVSAFIKSPTNNGGVTPNAAEPALILARNGTTAVTYPTIVEFKIRRWETGNNPRASTALDIAMTDAGNQAAGNDILSILSNGCVGIGTLQPNAKLHLAAGSATARTAPLQFTTAGSVVLATPVAGTMEVDPNDNLFYTITTGAARKRVVLTESSGGLTSGIVPYTTTNGRLTESADLVFNGGTGTLSVRYVHVNPSADVGGGGQIDLLQFMSDVSGPVFSGNPLRLAWDSDNLEFVLDDGGGIYLNLHIGQLALSNSISQYAGVATEGFGVAPIFDDVSLTNQSTGIGSTNFTNAGTVGTYRVSYYIVVTTADATAGSIRFDVTFNDGTAARTLTGATVALTATNRATVFTNVESNGSLIRLGSGSIAYSVTLTGAMNAARYALYATLERVS